jgi:hypothetical protein
LRVGGGALPRREDLVAAVPDMEPDGWFDPARLASLRADAAHVTVDRAKTSVTEAVR